MIGTAIMPLSSLKTVFDFLGLSNIGKFILHKGSEPILDPP